MLSKKMVGILLAVFISSVCLSAFGFHTVAMAQIMDSTGNNAPSGARSDPSHLQLTPVVSAASTIATIELPQISPEIEATPTPTEEPTPTVVPPTIAPSPTTIPQPTQPVASTATGNPGGLNADLLFTMANAFRQRLGLPEFQKDDRVCSLAASRAPEIAAEIAGGYMHAGLYARNLPYWSTENIITMRTEDAAFNWWVNDPPHRAALAGNYTHSCVACVGNACAQEFTSFQPK